MYNGCIITAKGLIMKQRILVSAVTAVMLVLSGCSSTRPADVARGDLSLANQLGIFYEPAGAALRATFVVDPDNVIQHVTVNNLDVGRNPDETLRILDALQTGELCPCSRPIGGETL
jgi:hypothetical protein